MIIFRSKHTTGNQYKGFLVGFDDLSDIEGIYWAVDELGFDPYELVFANMNNVAQGAVCWFVDHDSEFPENVDHEISENLMNKLHDKVNLWVKIAKKSDMDFEWEEG